MTPLSKPSNASSVEGGEATWPADSNATSPTRPSDRLDHKRLKTLSSAMFGGTSGHRRLPIGDSVIDPGVSD
jgi:hypothetical protein